MVNDHRAKLVRSGITDATTTGDIAQVIGDTEVVRHSTTVDAEGRTSSTRDTHHQMLASAAVLRQLRPLEGVLVYGPLPPIAVHLRAPVRRHEQPRGGRDRPTKRPTDAMGCCPTCTSLIPGTQPPNAAPRTARQAPVDLGGSAALSTRSMIRSS